MKQRLAILALAVLVPVAATVAFSAWLKQSDQFLLKFEGVKYGMPESEVKSLLGGPSSRLDTILTKTSNDGRLQRLIQKYGAGTHIHQWVYYVSAKTGNGFEVVEFLNANGEWRVVERYSFVKKYPVSEQVWRSLPSWLQW